MQFNLFVQRVGRMIEKSLSFNLGCGFFVNVAIIGRGLAGAWLAHELAGRGVEVRVLDNGHSDSASRVSAGLINPTTGARPQSSWRSNMLMPFAQHAYAKLEEATGVKCLAERKVRRVFRTPDDERLWRIAVDRGIGVQWTPIPHGALEGVPMPYGGVEYDGAVVDVAATLTVLEALDGVTVQQEQVETFDTTDVDAVVWCTGWHAAQHSLWSWLPWQPVKGEIIDAQISGPFLTGIYLRGIWVVPAVGGSASKGMQSVRIGSTHEWDTLNTETTAAARESLVETASILLERDMIVTGQRAGVRPALRTKRPAIGRHPEHPEHLILNGLGTKGALWAPWAGAQLAAHLLDGAPLDPEVSIQRWWNEAL